MSNFYPYPGYLNQRYLRELSVALVKALLADTDCCAVSVYVRKHREKGLKVEIHAWFPGECNTFISDVIYDIHIDRYMNVVRWREEFCRKGIKKLISYDDCVDCERFMRVWNSINDRIQKKLLELFKKVMNEYEGNYKKYYHQRYLTNYYWISILKHWNEKNGEL